VQLGFVHHTVTANDYGPGDSAGIVQSIARYHRDSNGWNDIGYNFVVDQYGQIFEARAGGIDQAIVGAQAQGYNSVSTGIACLGTFESVAFPEPGMEALAHLLGWKLTLHGVPVQGQVTVTSAGGESNRYPSGTPVTFERISGHRDGDSTSCPGGILYTQLPDLRGRALRYATPVSRVTLHTAARRVPAAGRPRSRASCTSPTAPRPPGSRCPSSTWPPVGRGPSSRAPPAGPTAAGPPRSRCPAAAPCARSSEATRRGRGSSPRR
jgi:uncharacterized protein with LGFP repeats